MVLRNFLLEIPPTMYIKSGTSLNTTAPAANHGIFSYSFTPGKTMAQHRSTHFSLSDGLASIPLRKFWIPKMVFFSDQLTCGPISNMNSLDGNSTQIQKEQPD